MISKQQQLGQAHASTHCTNGDNTVVKQGVLRGKQKLSIKEETLVMHTELAAYDGVCNLLHHQCQLW